jgi:hypothetical protein
MTIFYCLNSQTPPTWRAKFRIYFPQEQGGPVILSGSDTNRIEKVSSIIACFLIAGETKHPQSRSLAMAAALWPVYTT